MKKWIILSLLAPTIYAATGQQAFEQPREGAQIYLSDYELAVSNSDEVKLDIWIVRSKKATKSSFDAPKLIGTAGLIVDITADPEAKDHYIATITSQDTPNGNYSYTVSSRSRSIQKVKGTTLSIAVGKRDVVTKNE